MDHRRKADARPGRGTYVRERGRRGDAQAIVVLFLVSLVLAPFASPLPAQDAPGADSGRVRVVEIQGGLAEARPAAVVLPRGYDADGRRYPVLYLLHGLWGGHRDWIDRSDLLAFTAELPLIVVLPDVGDSWYTDAVARPGDRFADYVPVDVVDHVDRHFRTLPFPAARYVAGLSMGGYGALRGAAEHPGRFSLAASFSGAFHTATDTTWESVAEAFGPPGSEARRAGDLAGLLERADAERLPYLYLDCGTSDRLLGVNRAVAGVLSRRGVAYEYHEVAGGHSWEYWNRRLPVVLDLVRERIGALPKPEE